MEFLVIHVQGKLRVRKQCFAYFIFFLLVSLAAIQPQFTLSLEEKWVGYRK